MPKIIDEQARRASIAEAVWAIAARSGLEAATVRAVAAECGLSTGAIQHSFPTQAALQQFAMELIVQRVTARITALNGPEGSGAHGGSAPAADSAATAKTDDAATTVGRGTAADSRRATVPGPPSLPRATAVEPCPLPHPTINREEATEAIAAMLLQLLPLDDERETEARVWAAFSTAALVNPALAPYARTMDELLASFCRRCAEQLAAASSSRGIGANSVATAAPASAPAIAPDDRSLQGARLHALLDGLTLHLLTDPTADRRRQAEALVRSFLRQLAA